MLKIIKNTQPMDSANENESNRVYLILLYYLMCKKSVTQSQYIVQILDEMGPQIEYLMTKIDDSRKFTVIINLAAM